MKKSGSQLVGVVSWWPAQQIRGKVNGGASNHSLRCTGLHSLNVVASFSTGPTSLPKEKSILFETSQWKIFSLPPLTLSSRSRHEMAIILSCDDLRAILEKVWQYIFYHILKPTLAVQYRTVKTLPTLSFWHLPSRHRQLCQIISDLLDNQTLDTQELSNFFQTLTQTL